MKTLIYILGWIALIAVLALIGAYPTKWVWNWVVPDIFNLPLIDFWQALGLNILSGILINPSAGGKNNE